MRTLHILLSLSRSLAASFYPSIYLSLSVSPSRSLSLSPSLCLSVIANRHGVAHWVYISLMAFLGGRLLENVSQPSAHKH